VRRAARAALAVVSIALGGCGGGGGSDDVTVFAAASLTEPFRELAARFEATHAGTDVQISFAGSQQLVAQLVQGAEADVLATADEESMASAPVAGEPEVFATNRLTIVVEPGNPLGVARLADLAEPGITVVMAAPEVPAGRYADRLLDRAGVTLRPRSLEENVKAVVTRVALGEADAGIAYVTDAVAAAGRVDAVEIAEARHVEARYPIAVVEAGEQAEAFVALVLSDEGRAVLEQFGFGGP
jgi:molybdate transport system substrate-binding protein